MERADRARQNFLRGYNCGQSVVLAFSDLLDLSEKQLLRVSAPFGGGMGRLREACGAVSGMCMVLGLLFYDAEHITTEEKSALYAREQAVAARFREKFGSIVCRELLAGTGATSAPQAEERTEEYYKKRPCPALCAAAAGILEEYLSEEGVLPSGGENGR